MSRSSSKCSSEKTLEDILDAMRRNRDNSDVLEEIFTSLMGLSGEGKISRQGYVKVAVVIRDVLERFPGRMRFQKLSLLLISQAIQCNKDDFAVKIDKERWIPAAVLKAMRMHKTNIDIQSIGCGIVSALAHPSLRYVDQLLEVKALDAAIDALALALEMPAADVGSAAKALLIQRSVYGIILGIFPVDLAAKNVQQKPVVKNLQIVLQSMSTHMDSPEILAEAMASIHGAAYFNRPNADALGKEGVRIILAAMLTHEGDWQVQVVGCSALGFLVYKSPERKAYAQELGCLKHVLRVMSMHASKSDLQLGACVFLGFMMDDFKTDTDDVYRKELGDLGFITTVSEALRTHVRDAEVALHAAETLHRYTVVRSEQYRFKFFKDGGCDALMTAMQVNKRNLGILVSCLRGIDETLAGCMHTRLSETAELRFRLTCLTLDILSAHGTSDDGEIARCCSRVLMLCCPLNTYEAEIIKYDAIRVLVCCLQKHNCNEDMVREVCGLIGVSATHRTAIQDACRERGAIDALLVVAERYKDSNKILCVVRSGLTAITVDHAENSAYVMERMSSKQMKIFGRFDHIGAMTTRLQDNASMQNELGVDPQTQHGTLPVEKIIQTLKEACQEDVVAKRLMAYEEEKRAQVCWACGQSARMLGLPRLQKCSGCTTGASYCTVECQKAAWPKHKAECKANRKK
jgi:hypothetical protein